MRLEEAGDEHQLLESLLPMWEEERERCGGRLPPRPPSPPRAPRPLCPAVEAMRVDLKVSACKGKGRAQRHTRFGHARAQDVTSRPQALRCTGRLCAAPPRTCSSQAISAHIAAQLPPAPPTQPAATPAAAAAMGPSGGTRLAAEASPANAAPATGSAGAAAAGGLNSPGVALDALPPPPLSQPQV